MWLIRKKLFPLIASHIKVFLMLLVISMLGILSLVALVSSYQTMDRSLDDYLETWQYPDGIVNTTSLPLQILDSILEENADIDAVAGRLIVDLGVTREDGRTLTGRFFSYNEDNFNRLYVMEQGESDSTRLNVSVDKRFAENNAIEVGDLLKVSTPFGEEEVSVARIVSSTDSISVARDFYTSFDGSDFGYIFMEYEDLLELVGSEEQIINQVCFLVKADAQAGRSARAEALLADIEEQIGTERVVYAYTKADSDVMQVIDTSIEPLKTITCILPPMLFLVSMLFCSIFLSQIIRDQRSEIGILMALGFEKKAIAGLYMTFAMLIAALSGVMGIFSGLLLARGLSQIYATSFNIPDVIYVWNPAVYALAFALNLVFLTAGAYIAVRSVFQIQPSEAMKSRPPLTFKSSWLVRRICPWASPVTKVFISSISRNRRRFVLSTFCLMVSMMMILISFTYAQSMRVMLERTYEERYGQDCQMFLQDIRTAGEVESELSALTCLDRAECIRVETAKLAFGGNSEEVVINGISASDSLIRLWDAQGNPINLPEQGIVLDEHTANRLGIQVGDTVTLNEQEIRVTALASENINYTQYMTFEQANALFGTENMTNAVLLTCSKALTAETAAQEDDRPDESVETEVMQQLSQVDGYDYCSFTRVQKKEASFHLGKFAIAIYFAIAFAIGIGFAIVYNMSLINTMEREREFAIIKAMGYQNKSIIWNTFREVIFQFLIAGALGLPLGNLGGDWLLSEIRTESISYTNENDLSVYLFTAALVLGFIFIGHGLAVRRIRHMDLAETLKERD